MTKKFLLIHFLIFVLIFSGCGGGGGGGALEPIGSPNLGGCIVPSPEDNEIFSSLGGGRSVDVSHFNNEAIYTMVTALTANKLEGYGKSPVFCTGSLSTTSGIVLSSYSNLSKTINDRSMPSIFSSKQANLDLILRETENQLLARREKQLSKNMSNGINPSAPTPIELDTQWNNVEITTDGANFIKINTICKHITDQAYFFIDERDVGNMSSLLNGYGTAFEEIYSKNHQIFGTENDVDGNQKVIIVFSRELTNGLLGYFYAGDKFSKAIDPHSNEGDIFYLTADTSYNDDTIKATLAHEFQHMIYFDQHYEQGVINTQAWLNEALSQAAEYNNGFLVTHHNWITSFLSGGWKGLSLTYWTDRNYGYGAIFIRYLIDKFGDAAIKNMCSTRKVGIAAVEEATGQDFNTIFYNFTRALVLSGAVATVDPKYQFDTLDLPALQTDERKGLKPLDQHQAGDGGVIGLGPYEIYFGEWTGLFGSMKLSGDLAGDVYGLDTTP